MITEYVQSVRGLDAGDLMSQPPIGVHILACCHARSAISRGLLAAEEGATHDWRRRVSAQFLAASVTFGGETVFGYSARGEIERTIKLYLS